ncbi:rho GTPase-activating protein 21a isoform X3 [Denticeps clupeoides]|uniref:rho GTPase-activating protein 21a isoform X3 n=1 Tax=Denticeps clupeoides TaxID=299321 RepID=UPI0010A32662|nr:rho GTPase-activating protein 21 isoform X3 [Denticeps clupeoides]XP_028825717.1 rho GTPase-activating protein 21 isoform X3 [Denticeps clupeoides]
MDTRWSGSPHRQVTASPSWEAKQKDGCETSDMSAGCVSPMGEEEPFSWAGPKTLRLHRTSQGFGFTLRHFIVYPPESAINSTFKDDDNSSCRGRQRNRLEPMDTIFVKQVKEGGPAHGAGLCTGDRIVKVNGESIIGKTYSQVIALIQNSDTCLELCVMPKDEDILQLFSRDITALAYSQDAYLKGNEAYSGIAQNIPEPPSICYPRIEHKTSSATDLSWGAASGSCRRTAASSIPATQPEVKYCVETPGPASSPDPSQVTKTHTQAVVCVCNESARSVVAPPADAQASSEWGSRITSSGPGHRTEGNLYTPSTDPASARFRPLTTSMPSVAQQFTPTRSVEPSGHPSTGSSRRSPQPYPETPPANSPSHYTPSPPNSSSPCSPHQNIDWRNYTTYKEYIDNKRLYMYGCRTIQERLDSLRAAAAAVSRSNSLQQQQAPPVTSVAPVSLRSGLLGSQVRRRSTSHDRVYSAPSMVPLRSTSQDRLVGMVRDRGRDWPRSASQDALPSSSSSRSVPKARAHSCDFLGRPSAEGLGDRPAVFSRVVEERLCSAGKDRLSRQAETSPTSLGGSGGSDPTLTPRTEGHRMSRLPVKTSDPAASASSYVAIALASVQSHISSTNTTSADHLRDQRPVVGNHLSQVSIPTHLQHRGRSGSLQEPGSREVGRSLRSVSCSVSSKSTTSRTQQVATTSSTSPLTSNGRTSVPKATQGQGDVQGRANGKAPEGGTEGTGSKVVVVMRREKSGTQPIRHPSYILAVTDVAGTAGSGVDSSSMCWLPNDARREMHMRRLGEQHIVSCPSNLDDSLDSIPFIDEPSSPSIDHDSPHIPASAVISVTPSTPVITTIPPSPTSPSPMIRRQLSHDHDSLRLTILSSDSASKTERSKSYDEGLDNYREEGRAGRGLRAIAGLRGLRKPVDKSSEDSGSRRDSSSDVFSDATKEGLLHFRQLNSDKGKWGGGGMRPWKQMYVVLRGHTLNLYKDRKEGVAHANIQVEDEPLSISIKACLIDISYSDTKRKNVLRLTTSDCEYLFQAEDREDMLSWIRVIQDNSNVDEENAAVTSQDLISRKIKEYNTLMSPPSSKMEPSPKQSRSIRQTLLGGKGDTKSQSPQSPKQEQDRKALHKDETSPPKDKGTWRKGIPVLMRKPFEKKVPAGVTFGVRLDDCPPAQTNRFVPLIVEVCCKLVEERGLDYTGIYRVPGNNAAISNMQEELNRGMGDLDIQDDKWRDLNVISSLLKSFFRKLPEPLFTNERYGDFIEANRIEDPLERLKVLKRLLHELPDHHYETLKFLSAHLKTVADNSEKNKMEPRNLAIVFGPTLVRTSEDNMTHMVTHMPDQYKIVETLIQHYDWVFTDEDTEDPVTSVQQESAVESQPVPNIDHLLTNIGRTGTSPGEVSDSANSDPAKSKQGCVASGKDPSSRDLLVSSIFAAATRKRKKPKEKAQPSSSDDDLDAVFCTEPEEPPTTTTTTAGERAPPGPQPRGPVSGEKTAKSRKEHRNSFFRREKPTPSPSPSPKHRAPAPSQLDEPTSDLGTTSSGASGPRGGSRTWLEPAGTEVSSVTSDYSTTSSNTFPTGAESSAMLSPEAGSAAESRGGDEADDERSELVSEGRPVETDSDSDFPYFSSGGATLSAEHITTDRAGSARAGADGKDCLRLLPSHRLLECDTLSRRRSLWQKTDSDSSVEGGASSGGGREGSSSVRRLSRVLEMMRRGRSTGSLSSSSRSESERAATTTTTSGPASESAWRIKITERVKLRLRGSADDMSGVGSPKNRSPDLTRRASKKNKNIRRRHTMAGQGDFAELSAIHDWREEGGVAQAAELSAVDRLKPKCSSQDLSIRDWIARERGGSPAPPANEDRRDSVCRRATPPAPPSAVEPEPANGAASQAKTKAGLNLGGDAHPHKLSGAQVVRSRFYQYL